MLSNSNRKFQIKGQLIAFDHLSPLVGAMVKAYDDDILKDDFLGCAKSNRNGEFCISFNESSFTTGMTKWFEKGPDLYLQIETIMSSPFVSGIFTDDKDIQIIDLGQLPVPLANVPHPGLLTEGHERDENNQPVQGRLATKWSLMVEQSGPLFSPGDLFLPVFHDTDGDICRIRGRVLNADGKPIDGLHLIIADKDLVLDDRIAVGSTYGNGFFHCSFTINEFRRHLCEQEKCPELYIVFYARQNEKAPLKPIYKKEFFQRSICGDTDLGDIIIDDFTDVPTFHPELSLSPGYQGFARILSLSPNMLKDIAQEISPLVQRYTESDLSFEDVPLNIVTTKNQVSVHKNYLSYFFKDEFQDNFDIIKSVICHFLSQLCIAMYDPIKKSVYIFEGNVKNVNLDAFKLNVAHELVHHQQFMRNPILLDELQSMAAHISRYIDGNVPTKEFFVGLEEFMKKIKYDIEGEAEFIRYLLWKKHYPCATYFPGSMSLLQKAFCWSLSKVFPGFLKLLQDQYTEGLREYKRKKGI